MPLQQLQKLQQLNYLFGDVLAFRLEVIETAARKLKPREKFEIMMSVRELKRVRTSGLENIAGIVESLTRIETEQKNKGKQAARLATMRGQIEALDLVSEIIELHRQAAHGQITRESAPITRATYHRKGKQHAK